MAAVYKVEVVSHWANLTPKKLEEIVKKAIEDKTTNNVVEVRVERKA
jgi:hypothetical protein